MPSSPGTRASGTAISRSTPGSFGEKAFALPETIAISKNGLPLPNGMGADQPAPKSNVQRPQLPDDAELNRIMAVIEKVWRRMVEMILSVQRDLQKRI